MADLTAPIFRHFMSNILIVDMNFDCNDYELSNITNCERTQFELIYN
jgi:hypothetical protein